MGDWYLGEIRLFPYAKIPSGWHACDGTTLQVQGNQALFALLGFTYGGNGNTQFQLPDLRGRTPVGSSLTLPLPVGTAAGSEGVALTAQNLPAHTHNVTAYDGPGNNPSPVNALPAQIMPGQANWPKPTNMYGPPPASNAPTFDPSMIQSTGGAPHENRQPSMAMIYCIATQGIYPTRD